MFSKKHSTMTKGILIILMLAHHLFFPGQIPMYEVHTLLEGQTRIDQLILFFRICVAGFSFLSAYGITCTLKNSISHGTKTDMSVILKRVIKLESAAVIIYILAVLYMEFAMGQSVFTFYSPSGPDTAHSILCMFLDALGFASFMGSPLLNVTWWYLSYAILVIAIMPFLYRAYGKFRYALLPAACLVALSIPNNRGDFWNFLPTVFLGCAFAYEGWFEKLRDWKKGNKLIKTGKFLACLFLLYLSYALSKYTSLEFSSLLVFVIPYMVYEFFAGLPVLNVCLEFLGRHATNIFLIHTFIYLNFHDTFIYSFKDSWKIMSVLLGLCLLLSVLIELLKKFTGYNKLTAKLLQLVDSKMQETADNTAKM